jgi:hypothetical protein
LVVAAGKVLRSYGVVLEKHSVHPDLMGGFMRRLIVLVTVSSAFAGGSAAALAAGNPSPTGTGPPSQSCQAQPSSPGHASSSPGAPFNEPSGSNLGGTGGQNYSPQSQYDVACYQVSTH